MDTIRLILPSQVGTWEGNISLAIGILLLNKQMP